MQTHDWILLAVGIFIGAPVGMLVMGLCVLARKSQLDDYDQLSAIVHSKAYYAALDEVIKTKLTIVEGGKK